MKLYLMILWVSALILNGAASAQTKTNLLEGFDTTPMIRWWTHISISKELHITKKETKRLDAIYKENQTRVIELKLEARKEMLELEMEMGSEKFDTAASIERFKNIQNLRSEISVEHFSYWLEIREIIGHQRLLKAISWWKNKWNEGKP